MNTQTLPPFESRKGAGWMGDLSRGAAMGRNQFNPHLTGKVHLRRVRLDSGGYDKGGAYWGQGQPLWAAWDDSGEQVYIRADSRDAAKAEVLESHAVKFYR